MSISGILLVHSAARRAGKPPFFFSRFNFDRMKEKGNTHYCFHCGGDQGFKPGPNGEAVDGDSSLNRHDSAAHAGGVIGNANNYNNPWDWLEQEIPADFPYVVSIPGI